MRKEGSEREREVLKKHVTKGTNFGRNTTELETYSYCDRRHVHENILYIFRHLIKIFKMINNIYYLFILIISTFNNRIIKENSETLVENQLL